MPFGFGFLFFAKIEPENRKNIFQQKLCGTICEHRKIFKQFQIFGSFWSLFLLFLNLGQIIFAITVFGQEIYGNALPKRRALRFSDAKVFGIISILKCWKTFGTYLGILDSCDSSLDSILIFLIAESNILSTEPLQSHQYLYSWAAHFYIKRHDFV